MGHVSQQRLRDMVGDAFVNLEVIRKIAPPQLLSDSDDYTLEKAQLVLREMFNRLFHEAHRGA